MVSSFPSDLGEGGAHQWAPGLVLRQDAISQVGASLVPAVGQGKSSRGRGQRGAGPGLLTFEQGADVPDVYAAGLHELAQRDLQEENGDSSDQGDQDVGNKEHT